MKLYIKQRVFSLGEDFTVKNEHEEDVFYVGGSFFQIPKQFTIYNRNQEAVAKIERQLFRFLSHYDIQLPNQAVVTLRKEFSFLKPVFSLEGTDWLLQGDFFAHNYAVLSGGSPVMTLQKQWFTWGDSYELDITREEDALLALAIAICIDHELARQNSANSAPK